jgi:hypothetical protein
MRHSVERKLVGWVEAALAAGETRHLRGSASLGLASARPKLRHSPLCEAVCVDPRRVRAVWPRVSGLIHAAMRRGDLSSYAALEASVLAGDALLWLVRDGLELPAAAVTELQQTEWRKVCVIVACGGADMSRWIDLIARIEAYARAERCAAVRIIGREGWGRLLTAYRPKRVVLEKELQ